MRRALLLAGVAVAALVGGITHEVSARAEQARAPRPSSDDTRVGRELSKLADAWAVGGGTYGYPFWDKAQSRWHAGQISASVFREYVTSYRDSLRAGCEGVRTSEAKTSEAKRVRGLLVDACSDRIDALQAQREQLDALIEKSVLMPIEPARRPAGTPPTEIDAAELADRAAARAERALELDERTAERGAAFVEALQRSYRNTREAMTDAQSALDVRSLPRLAEDAFV